MRTIHFSKILYDLKIDLINETYQRKINESKTIVKKIDSGLEIIDDYKQLLIYFRLAFKEYKNNHKGVSLFFHKTKKYDRFYIPLACSMSKKYKLSLFENIYNLVLEMRSITKNFSDTWYYDEWMNEIKSLESEITNEVIQGKGKS